MKSLIRLVCVAALLLGLGAFALYFDTQDALAGSAGRPLRAVWLIVRTGNVGDGGTDDQIQLTVQQRRKPGFPIVDMPVGSFSWDENERDRTETYTWLLDRGPHQNADLRDVDFDNVCIETLGTDAWFIHSIWIMGMTNTGEVIMLGANPYFNA